MVSIKMMHVNERWKATVKTTEVGRKNRKKIENRKDGKVHEWVKLVFCKAKLPPFPGAPRTIAAEKKALLVPPGGGGGGRDGNSRPPVLF